MKIKKEEVPQSDEEDDLRFALSCLISLCPSFAERAEIFKCFDHLQSLSHPLNWTANVQFPTHLQFQKDIQPKMREQTEFLELLTTNNTSINSKFMSISSATFGGMTLRFWDSFVFFASP